MLGFSVEDLVGSSLTGRQSLAVLPILSFTSVARSAAFQTCAMFRMPAGELVCQHLFDSLCPDKRPHTQMPNFMRTSNPEILIPSRFDIEV